MENIKKYNQFTLNESIWDSHGDRLPSIFKQTIYRLPTDEELIEVDSFKLKSADIIQGVGYTIIGRGMRSLENKRLIIQTIEKLIELFPSNIEYLTALDKANELKIK